MKKSLIIGGIFVTLFLLVRYIGIADYLTFAWFGAQRDWLLYTVQQQYWVSVFAYIGIYICVVAFSLPAVLLLTVVSGFLFGTVLGALYANCGATIGAVISYAMVRYSLGDLLFEKYKTKFVEFQTLLDQYGAWYLLGVHQVIFIPFGVINIMAGIARVSVWTFIWTTIVGILPAQLLFTHIGSRLASISSLYDLFSPTLVALLATVSFVMIGGFIVHLRLITRKN